MNLDTLPIGAIARISAIDWAAIPETEGHRLRSLGIDAGATVEPMHKGILFLARPDCRARGPHAVAMRRKVASRFSARCQRDRSRSLGRVGR